MQSVLLQTPNEPFLRWIFNICPCNSHSLLSWLLTATPAFSSGVHKLTGGFLSLAFMLWSQAWEHIMPGLLLTCPPWKSELRGVFIKCQLSRLLWTKLAVDVVFHLYSQLPCSETKSHLLHSSLKGPVLLGSFPFQTSLWGRLSNAAGKWRPYDEKAQVQAPHLHGCVTSFRPLNLFRLHS